jgi:hypothetical protein
MGMVRRFLVIARFMMSGSFAMVSCRVFVVFCRLIVVICAHMGTHNLHLSCNAGISQSGSAVPANSHLAAYFTHVDGLMKFRLEGYRKPPLLAGGPP